MQINTNTMDKELKGFDIQQQSYDLSFAWIVLPNNLTTSNMHINTEA